MNKINKILIIIGIVVYCIMLIFINCNYPMIKNNKINIYIEKDNNNRERFKDNKNFNIINIPDSEINEFKVIEYDTKKIGEIENKENIKLRKTKFMYNTIDEKIEIVGYKESLKNIIIPSKIDNIAVNKIDLNIRKGFVEGIYIPKEVKEINIELIDMYEFDKENMILVNSCLTLGLIIYILTIISIKNRNKEENFYNGIMYIFSILYLLIISIFTLFFRKNYQTSISIISKNIILNLIYIIFIIVFKYYKKILIK